MTVEDFADFFGVQGGRGLVEEHDLGVHGQGPGDRDALLLAAGELGRVVVAETGQADAGQQLVGPLGGLLPVSAFDQHGAGHDVLLGGHVGEEVELLEDHADSGALLGDFLLAEGMVGGFGFVVAEVFAVDFQDS